MVGRRGGARRIGGRRRLAGMVTGLLAATTVVVAAGGPATAGVSPYHRFPGTVAGDRTIPDGAAGCASPGAARELAFTVSGVPTGSPLTGVRVSGLMLSHPRVGDLTATLVAPGGGARHVLFSRTGVSRDDPDGYDARLVGPYAFSDDRSTEWWTWAAGSEVPAGRYFATAPGDPGGSGPVRTGLTAAFAGIADPNGVWTLRVSDQCQGPAGGTGELGTATLELKTAHDDINSCIAEGMRTASAQADLATAEETLASARTTLAAAAGEQGAAEATRLAAVADEASAGTAGTTAQQAREAARQAVTTAKAAVAKAARQLRKAKRADRSQAVARAKARLKRAKRTLQAATAKEQTAATAVGTTASASAGARTASAAASAAAAQAGAARTAADTAYDAAWAAWQAARNRLEQARGTEAFCLDS